MAIVSKWTLDSNSNDSVGSLNGVDTDISYVPGFLGNGASFNGSTSYITMGNVLDTDGSTPFSMSFLMKLNSVTQNQMLVGKQLGSGSFGGYMIWYQYSAGVTANLNFSLVSNDGTFGLIEIVTPINEIIAGNYYFVCVTYNGSKNATGAKVYINGVDKGSIFNNSLSTKSISTAANFNIGSRNNGGLSTNGILDDVIFYDTALTPGEVLIINNTYFNIPNGKIVGKWSLNGNSNDSVGTLNGVDTNITYVGGKSGQAASFNGASSDILINNCDINITTTYSIGMLLKYNTLPSSGSVYNLIIKGEPVNPVNGFDYIVYNNSGVYQIYMTHATASGGTFYFFNIPTPVQGTWYYYVIKYESNQLSFYINGILVGTQTATVAPTFNTNLMYFGYNGMAGIRRFNGVMDNVEIYNTALSDSQIKNKYLYYNGFM